MVKFFIVYDGINVPEYSRSTGLQGHGPELRGHDFNEYGETSLQLQAFRVCFRMLLLH